MATTASIKCAFDALGSSHWRSRCRTFKTSTTARSSSSGRLVTRWSTSGGLELEANAAIGSQTPENAYRQVWKLDHGDADGVFISCTNYRTFEIIEQLEDDLDKPVVTSNQATLWDAMRNAGVDADLPLGRLFEH